MANTVSPSQPSKSISAAKAVLVGHLIISLPVLAIFVGAMILGAIIARDVWLLFVLAGFVVSWLWWSVAAPRWRAWALDRGAPPEQLQKLAVATGLLWRKGSVFERTEIRPRDK